MDNKEKYFRAFKADNGHLDEIDLGESVNINEESTRRIISLLLSEHKIEYVVNGACNYSIKRKKLNN